MAGGAIVVPGNPVSVNAAFRRMPGRYGMYMSSEYRNWKEIVAMSAKVDWRQPPIKGRVKLELFIFYSTKRKTDLDNAAKGVLDGLSGVVYLDDSQVDDLRLIRRHDTKKPRVEIIASEI